jgi:hypothetical protein
MQEWLQCMHGGLSNEEFCPEDGLSERGGWNSETDAGTMIRVIGDFLGLFGLSGIFGPPASTSVLSTSVLC